MSKRQVSTRNATFQQWQALLDNRNKRYRASRFFVQGVRPIDEAVAAGWTITDWLVRDAPGLSSWAIQHAEGTPGRTSAGTAVTHSVAPELMDELGGKDGGSPELLAVIEMPADDLSRISCGHDFLGVLFDRPSNPGNVGTILRSLDAFGGSALIVTGHATDPYDPRSVRSSTGSLFRVPTVRCDSNDAVLAWVGQVRDSGIGLQLLGTDESGDVPIDAVDLTRPSLILTGNETRGLSRAWKEACDYLVTIPMSGHASSLNAASATSIALYEAARQRR